MIEIDTKTKFLYENFRQVLDVYRDPILIGYEKVLKGKIDDENLSPAQLCDCLAMVMYEVENYDEGI